MGEMLLLLFACDEEDAPEEELASGCWVEPLLLVIVPSAIMLSTVFGGATPPVAVAAAEVDEPAPPPPLPLPVPLKIPDSDNFIGKFVIIAPISSHHRTRASFEKHVERVFCF